MIKDFYYTKRLRVIFSKSPSVAKKDPRIWEGYGLDKRWHYYYITSELRGYSGKVKSLLISESLD